MEMDFKQLAVAIRALADEKNLPEDTVQEIVEQALAAAYRRDYGDREQEVRVSMNLNTGDVDAYTTKEVVEVIGDGNFEISLSDAQKVKKGAVKGDMVEVHEQVHDFGRVAAQTAKQVILQRLRETERETVMAEYEDKIGTLVNGVVTRVEGNIVRIELGKAQAILPRSEQSQNEHYYAGQRIKVFLKDVEKGFRGPQLVVSRSCNEFIELLFRAEVPEMDAGAVEIKAVAREGGVRSKVAVSSNVQGVDPVGTFVGGHGTRVNAVMSEIGEQEKIDIVVWSDDTKEYIINALSPTKIIRVEINDQTKRAKVVVPEDQLSIAIGRGGQNVRLASKLSGYELDIAANEAPQEASDEAVEAIEPLVPAESNQGAVKDVVTPTPKPQPSVATKKVKAAQPRLKKKEQLESSLLEAIEEHGTEQ
jgi:N utilization substance protein A